MTGFILYRGPSLIDGRPIVAIANCLRGTRANRKTGPAIQTYIIRSDLSPAEAVRDGADASVCGACPLRPVVSSVCYVELGKGVHWTWQAFAAGLYPDFDYQEHADLIRGRFARIGTYGDPATVPFETWRDFTAMLGNWSGYTHQWRLCDQRLRGLLMASVDSSREAEEAWRLGWRTFRVRLPEEPVGAGEITCPSSDEGGHRRQCVTCKACRGSRPAGSATARSVAIIVHGRPWKAAQFRRLRLA